MHEGTKKKKEESFLNRMPAEYANTTYLIAKGGAVDLELDQKKLPKSKKVPKRLKPDDEEMESIEAVDTWDRSNPKSQLIKIGLNAKSRNIGIWQSSHIIQKCKFLLIIIFIFSNLYHLFLGVTDPKPNVKTNELDDEIHETINANKSIIVDDYSKDSFIDYIIGDNKISILDKNNLLENKRIKDNVNHCSYFKL